MLSINLNFGMKLKVKRGIILIVDFFPWLSVNALFWFYCSRINPSGLVIPTHCLLWKRNTTCPGSALFTFGQPPRTYVTCYFS